MHFAFETPSPGSSPVAGAISRPGLSREHRSTHSRGAHLLYVFTGRPSGALFLPDQLFDAFPRSNLRASVEHEYMPGAGHTFAERAPCSNGSKRA